MLKQDKYTIDPGSQIYRSNQNKTSMQQTPGSQVYLNIKKKKFGQK